MSEKSRAQLVAELPEKTKSEWLASLTPDELARLDYDLQWNWEWKGRPSQQIPDGDWWDTCLWMAGRGWGKSATGTQAIAKSVESGIQHSSIIVPTFGDIEKTLLQGEAGLLRSLPTGRRPRWVGGRNLFEWPSGAVTLVFSAEEPERLRGPEHEIVWWDEMAACRYAQDAWDMMQMGLRLGKHPRCLITTTPRPTAMVRSLIADPTTIVIRGATYDNAPNLASSFLNRLLRKYEGTRLGRQEINAEILDDNPNALWNRKQIDSLRISPARLPRLTYIVVGVDPGGSSEEGSDATGIVAVGRDDQNPPHFYVLSDLTMIASPAEWGAAAICCFDDNQANKIVAEKNYGGEMVGHVIKTSCAGRAIAPFDLVSASRGKDVRAEPVSMLYEQGRFHHVGSFPQLEDEMCDWVPGDKRAKSPNRMDALVWASYGCGVVGEENAMDAFLSKKIHV